MGRTEGHRAEAVGHWDEAMQIAKAELRLDRDRDGVAFPLGGHWLTGTTAWASEAEQLTTPRRGRTSMVTAVREMKEANKVRKFLS
jgi:hypothetical protein